MAMVFLTRKLQRGETAKEFIEEMGFYEVFTCSWKSAGESFPCSQRTKSKKFTQDRG